MCVFHVCLLFVFSPIFLSESGFVELVKQAFYVKRYATKFISIMKSFSNFIGLLMAINSPIITRHVSETLSITGLPVFVEKFKSNWKNSRF